MTLGTLSLYTGPMGMALEVLRSNYLIVGEEFGVEFSQADQLACLWGKGRRPPALTWRRGCSLNF